MVAVFCETHRVSQPAAKVLASLPFSQCHHQMPSQTNCPSRPAACCPTLSKPLKQERAVVRLQKTS